MDRKMKAAVFHGKRHIEVETLDVPVCKPNEVLLKTIYTAICGSDMHPYRTGKGRKAGQIFGHEFVGEIAALGEDISIYRIGDRVFGENFSVCGECWYCRKGDYVHCIRSREHFTGIGRPGGFAQYFTFTVPEEKSQPTTHFNHLLKLPEEIPDTHAALIEPYGVGLAAVKMAKVSAGDTVVILGAGAIGQCVLQWCKARGATVVITDISAKRLDCASRGGADYVIDNTEGDCYRQVAAILGEAGWLEGADTTTADIVFDCAGYAGSLNDALRLARCGGTVCEISVCEQPSTVDPTYITYKDLRIINSTDTDAVGAIEGMRRKDVDPSLLVGTILPLEQIDKAFQLQERGEVVKALIRLDD